MRNYDEDESIDSLATKRLVRNFENHIYFYDDVDPETHLLFCKSLQDANKYAEDKKQPIYLHINSGGGDLISGLAMYDILSINKSPVVGIVEGMAASAASIILLGCSYRCMTKSSFVLIHELSNIAYGKKYEIDDAKENNDTFMETVIGIYKEKTRIPEATLRGDLLRHDKFWNYQKAYDFGIVEGPYGFDDPKAIAALEEQERIEQEERIAQQLEDAKQFIAEHTPRKKVTEVVEKKVKRTKK